MRRKHPAMARLAALMLCLCCASGLLGASAEEAAVWTALQPVMDLTASAALRVGDIPENISAGGMLSEAFVYNFFLLGQTADTSVGVTADMLLNTEAQAQLLNSLYASALPNLSGVLSLGETYDYIGVRVMASDVSEDGSAMRIIGDLYEGVGPLSGMTEEQYGQVSWLDKRALIEFRKDDAAQNGWRLTTFSVDADLAMEDASSAYFAQTMVEYINAEMGFSIQYPAIFTEDVVKDDANGISAQLADGSASFFAKRVANDGGWTLEKFMDAKKQENPAAEMNINDIVGCGSVTAARQDGGWVTDLYIVTPEWIYQAEISYAAALAKDFSLYTDYMMNSFTADELGIG